MKLFLAVIATLLLGTGWAAGNPAAAQNRTVRGEVLEIREVDAYSYLRLRTQDGEIWAAVGKAPVRKGAQVTIENTSVMSNFESKSLKKTFDRIVFGTLAIAAPGAAVSEVVDVKVPKAEGRDARTVAEIVGKRAGLKEKPVAVRGKVVKFTQNVMGKNWVHLRDGSGSAKDSTNDLLVTTMDRTQVGEVVVARGIVRTDVELGSGYSYKVLVDGATLQK